MQGTILSRARDARIPKAAAFALAATLALTGAASAVAPMRSVIVMGADVRNAADAVRASGGTVSMSLPIVNGVSAQVREDAIASLSARPGIVGVTPNRAVHVASIASRSASSGSNDSVFARETKADWAWWAGYDGSGVRVALVDTGVNTSVQDLSDRVAPVPDPTGTGKLVQCVDFSGEASCNDSYGHGTFIAGLIAGTGALSNGTYKGVAPGAEIVSIKIAGRDGSADVSKVLAAIQWVVSFAPELNIRVLNLSLGTNSPVSYRIDPLNFAVERAWRSGIVVVVSAGNRGARTAQGAPQTATISKPADDPLVLTVGAVDDRATPGISDDRVPFFSAHGPTITDGIAKPDVVAPGGHVISLRSPGSFVEQSAPSSSPDSNYRRGSGTSMAAGIVSGLAALLLEKNPTWQPDRVKYAFIAGAHKVAVDDPLWVGKGIVDVVAANFAAAGLANQNVSTLSDASGSLDGARADVIVTAQCMGNRALVDPNCGKAIRGNQTAQGTMYDAQAYAQNNWTGSSWYQSQWNGLLGSSWYGSSWYGSSWYGSSWYGSSWYGSWDDGSYGVSLPGSSWYGFWD